MAVMNYPEGMAPHIQQVFNNEYAIPGYTKVDPVILDIGANVGAFAIWAFTKWPEATIHCYEPNPSNFEYLKNNLESIHPTKKYILHNVAVGDPEHNKLFLGKHNCGECSFFQLGEQTDSFIPVITISPKELPEANILKMDTEGSELNILEGLNVNLYDAITFEYHRESDRRDIDLQLIDFDLVHGFIRCKDRGVLSYIKKS
jgi:FkbM family methyltransferase